MAPKVTSDETLDVAHFFAFLARDDCTPVEVIVAVRRLQRALQASMSGEFERSNKSAEFLNSMLRVDGLDALRRWSESSAHPDAAELATKLIERTVPMIWQS